MYFKIFIRILFVLNCIYPYNFLGLKIDDLVNIWRTEREIDDEGDWNCTGNSSDNFACVDLGQSRRRSVPITFTQRPQEPMLLMDHNNKHRRGVYNKTTGIIEWEIFDILNNETTDEFKFWRKGISVC